LVAYRISGDSIGTGRDRSTGYGGGGGGKRVVD